MAEEKKLPEIKQLKTNFAEDIELPTHFINAVNVRAGLEEFYFTLGTATPVEISNIQELENLETINAHPVFRFAMTRTVMKQMIDVINSVYEVQTQQLNMMQGLQEQERENDGDSTVS